MLKKSVLVLLLIVIGLIFGWFTFYNKKEVRDLGLDKRTFTSVGEEFIYPSEIPSQPKVFLHGSSQRLDYIAPKSISARSDNEGNVVFATSNLAYAALFTFAAPRDKERPKIRLFMFDDEWRVICNNKKLWDKYDTGGYIHVVPSDTFYVDLGFKSLTRKQWMSQAYNPEWGGLSEWVTKEKVPVLYAFKIDSTLDAVIDLGVHMYFVDQDTFDQWKSINNEDDLEIFMQNLVSENQNRGV